MRKVFVVLALILLVCTGCGVEPNQTSADITISSPSTNSTPEPAASATVKPKPTETDNFKLNSDSIILHSGLKISDMEGYFEFTGSELIQKLGNGYEKVETGIEGTWDGYYYRELGITLTFNDYDYSFNEAPLIWIECDVNKLELNGLTRDMNFKQIQARIGKGKIEKTEYEEGSEEYEYDLTYKIGNVKLIFGSFTNDARDNYWVKIE